MCTTGHLQMTRYNVGEHVSRGNNEEKHALKWFVRYVKEAINERARHAILTCARVGRAHTVLAAGAGLVVCYFVIIIIIRLFCPIFSVLFKTT